MTPTRDAFENEDKFTQFYIHGEFHAYALKGQTVKAYAKMMKSQGFKQTGFTLGGAYMKVNFAKPGFTK
jgi:hypothetical protein